MYCATEARRIGQPSTSEYRYDRCSFARAISGFEHERGGESPAAGERDGRGRAHSAAHVVRHGRLCLACGLRQHREFAFGAFPLAPERN